MLSFSAITISAFTIRYPLGVSLINQLSKAITGEDCVKQTKIQCTYVLAIVLCNCFACPCLMDKDIKAQMRLSSFI